jgi:hypothetical protein
MTQSEGGVEARECRTPVYRRETCTGSEGVTFVGPSILGSTIRWLRSPRLRWGCNGEGHRAP